MSPLVSVVLAARDARATIDQAVTSVLRQSLRDLELVVVDDGSVDGTGALLADVGDPRLRVVRNDQSLGLAGALNAGLGEAGGRYVARLDADDIARPAWLERLVRRMRSAPAAAVVGTAAVDFGDDGRVGRVHRMPSGARAVRWAARVAAPCLHPTVLVDRSARRPRPPLRHDVRGADYDLWAPPRPADGDNLMGLVLYRRRQPGSTRRADVQRLPATCRAASGHELAPR
jgi:glycosyltransferase involved in cell wall biosynthesis